MVQRKLSILQQAYKEFFLDVLHEYSVDSPAKLSLEQKGIFFTNIKSGWKIKKAALFEKKNLKNQNLRKILTLGLRLQNLQLVLVLKKTQDRYLKIPKRSMK